VYDGGNPAAPGPGHSLGPESEHVHRTRDATHGHGHTVTDDLLNTNCLDTGDDRDHDRVK
jgi:hypothetical protein